MKNLYRVILLYTLIFSLTYFDTFIIGFLSDDYIILNVFKKHGFSFNYKELNDSFYLPITHLFTYFQYLIFDLNPLPYRIVQYVFHITNSVLIYQLATRVFSKKEGKFTMSLFAGLIFLIHPYQTEAVVWLSSKSYLYAVFFGLLASIHYINYIETKRKKHLWISTGLLFSSFLCKEITLILPIIMILYNWGFYRGKIYRESIAFFFIAIIIYFIFRWQGIGSFVGGYGADVHLISIKELAQKGVAFLSKLLLHYRFFVEYLSAWLSISIISLLTLNSILFLFVVVWFRDNKKLIKIISILAISLLPVVSLEITSLHQIQSDRYTYLPIIILSFLIVIIISKFRKLNLRVIILSIVVVGFIFITLQENKKWKNSNIIARIFQSEIMNRQPENKSVIVNVPDNYKGAICMRNGTSHWYEIKSNKKLKQYFTQEYNSINGGITLEKHNEDQRKFKVKIENDSPIYIYNDTTFEISQSAQTWYFNQQELVQYEPF